MNRIGVACAIGLVATGGAVAADGPETLADWQWYQEVRLPPTAGAGYLDFLVPPAVFGQAREDLHDLRLYDANGREVEYALRVRRGRDDRTLLEAKPYDRVTGPGRAAELRLDLGGGAVEHNAIEVDAPGHNVRRRFRLEGSDRDGDWRALHTDWQVRYEYGTQRMDVRHFRYPVSRFRYLRLTLEPDPTADRDAPEIAAARVYRSVLVPGEDVTLEAALGPREPVRGDGGPGSAWLIDFGDDRPPVERLSFDIADEEFVRPFRLEAVSDEGGPTHLMGGEWRRRAGSGSRPMEVVLPSETRPHKLRLVVTDHRNRPLEVLRVRYTAPARQVVFPAKAGLAGPLRLYFGNPKAQEPGYDFARTLPVEVDPRPVRLTVGASVTDPPLPNPVFRPEPRPLTERYPWLVYVVLTLACLSLLGLLGVLGRKAIGRHDATAGGTVTRRTEAIGPGGSVT